MYKTKYAGRHLILDLYGVHPELLQNDILLSEILLKSAKKSKATILNKHFHHFGEGYGCTGVIVLAESHISIHTWPETGYASIDIFMCGKCNPSIAARYIKNRIAHSYSTENVIYRGNNIPQ